MSRLDLPSDSVPARALQAGSVTRRAIVRHAVGRDELQPGIIDGGMLSPRSVQVVHIGQDVEGQFGNASQLLSLLADDVEVDVGWQPVVWDAVQGDQQGYTVDGAGLTATVGGVHVLHPTLTWATYDGGGSVRILVGETVVWGPDEDPQWTAASGGQFAGTVALKLSRGDVLTVEVNSGSASAQTASAVRCQIALPDPEGVAGITPEPGAPFWPFPNWPTFGYDDGEWLLAVGDSGGLVGNIRPTGPYVISLPTHPQYDDGLWLLAVGDSGGLVGNIPSEA